MAADSTTSARSLLVDWANRQDGWVRAIVGEVLLSRRELSVHELERVKDSFLVEKQLAEGEPLEAPHLGEDGVADDESQALSLRALRDCRGVNALAEDQAIEFNARLTVLFGENATGKTGYVRVFKRVANVRSAEEILPDIHRATPAPTPEALIRYAVNGKEHDIAWHGETGVSPLTRISVFDAPAVAVHLEDDLTYVYTPADLALFRYVHAAIEGVRSLLDDERGKREPRQNPFLTAFVRESSVYPQVEQLGANTQIADLERLADVTDDERTEVETLKASIEALGSQTGHGSSEMLRSRIAVLKALDVVAAAVEAFNRDQLSHALANWRTAKDRRDAAAAAVFGGSALPEPVRPAWQAFIEAGEHYLDAAGLDDYPQPDNPCAYCQQPLEQPAVALIRSYRAYASGEAAADLESAAVSLREAKAPLLAANVATALGTLGNLLPAMEDGEASPAWVTKGRRLLDVLHEARSLLTPDGDIATDALPDVALAPAFRSRLTTALADAEQTLQGLQGDADKRRELLSEQRARLGTLEGRLTLARLLPEIRTFVENAGWASRVKLLVGQFTSLLRGLTEVSKLASDQVLNQNFQQAFYEECRALRAPNVTLGFPGRRGQAARRKSVAADHSLTKVLSEGEQKVIAMADFLAEASFRAGSAPIVFDDPVTSLDHRRLHEMVDRIVALSEEHQVIVLTHNIWFASELLARFDERSDQCSFFQVSERDGAKGLITGGAHPRIDTPNKIKGRINKGIQDAKAAGEDQRADHIETTYDHVRAWCEAVVEKDLLGQVTRRYQPNVAMQNLERIKTERLGQAIEVVLPIYERACRYIAAHSQPIETLGVRPTMEELEADWQSLQEAHKAYIS